MNNNKEVDFRVKVKRAINYINKNWYWVNIDEIVNHYGRRVLNNKDVSLALIKKRPSLYINLSDNNKSNKEIAIAAIKGSYNNYEIMPIQLQDDPELAIIAIKSGVKYSKLSEKAKSIKSVAAVALEVNSWEFCNVPEPLRNDLELAFPAIKDRVYNIAYAGNDVQNNKEVIDYVVKKSSLQYVPNIGSDLLNDKQYILHLINDYLQKEPVKVLCKYLGPDLVTDRDVALAAVSVDGMSIESFSDEIKNDEEVVLVAVRQNGRAIKIVNKRFKKDRKVALVALATNSDIFFDLDISLQTDPEVVRFNLVENYESSVQDQRFQQFYKTYMLFLTSQIIASQEELKKGYEELKEQLQGYEKKEASENKGISRNRKKRP
ncbi:MAG: DUF4116 domain-containing protein [Bacilli bacterium]|nr:DUF4116 domain-containing protein [Bacilli bacterium]